MLSFRDFLAVNYTGQTPQQDLNAKKRHRGVVGEEAPAEKKDKKSEKTKDQPRKAEKS